MLTPVDFIAVSRSLDDLPYNHLCELFHGVYKSTRLASARKKQHGFNPIRDGHPVEMNSEAALLVSEIRDLILTFGE